MNHTLSIIATVPACPPYINEGGKGYEQAVFIDNVFLAANKYTGELTSVTECANNVNFSPNKIIVIDETTGNLLFEKDISNTTPGEVAGLINSLQNAFYDSEHKVYTTTEGDRITPLRSLLAPGFGLFNLPFDIPKAVFWVMFAASSYKMNSARTTAAKVGWGALAAVAVGNAISK